VDPNVKLVPRKAPFHELATDRADAGRATVVGTPIVVDAVSAIASIENTFRPSMLLLRQRPIMRDCYAESDRARLIERRPIVPQNLAGHLR
jgi:hypothetical protein